MFFKIAGIVAGSSYAPVDIVSRVVRKSILGVLVIVRCGTSGGKPIIREIGSECEVLFKLAL